MAVSSCHSQRRLDCETGAARYHADVVGQRGLAFGGVGRGVWSMRLSSVVLGAAAAAFVIGASVVHADDAIGLLASRSTASAFTPEILPQGKETKKEQLARIFTPALVEQLWMNDYADLDSACERGWLVDVPDDPAGLGIHVRKSGNCPVGEKEHDLARRAKLYRLAKPAAGLLYRIAEHLRQTEGNAFTPVQVSSLVRPWTYQKKLMASNANANTIRAGVPPTHVFGLAFDLPRGDMSSIRERNLQRYLDLLADAGKVVYFKEGKAQATFHIIALPGAGQEFEADFYELTARAAHSPTSLVCAGDNNPDFLHDEIWW